MNALVDFVKTLTGQRASELLGWLEHEHHRRGEIIRKEIRRMEDDYVEGESDDRSRGA